MATLIPYRFYGVDEERKGDKGVLIMVERKKSPEKIHNRRTSIRILLHS